MKDKLNELQSRLLRILLRQGGSMREGLLANQVGLRLSEPEFDGELSPLSRAGLAEVVPTGFGRNRCVRLTEKGTMEAERLREEKNKQVAEILAQAK